MVAGCLLAWSIVLEVGTARVRCVVAYCCTIIICDTYVQPPSRRKCYRKFLANYVARTVSYKATIHDFAIKIRYTSSVMDKKKSRKGHGDWRKHWHRYGIRGKPKEVVTSLDYSFWAGQKKSSRWYKIAKIAAVQKICMLFVKCCCSRSMGLVCS
jgi:hypothetical protein